MVWAASGDGKEFFYINPAVEKVYGRRQEEFLANANLWLEVIHPEDRARAKEAETQLFRTGHADVEYRIVRPDGEVRWLRDRKSVVYDAAGKAVQIGGFATDITRRKNGEERAKWHEEQLKSLSLALSLAEEKERRRLAGNLHDGLVQILGLIQIKLSLLEQTSGEAARQAVLKEIEDLVARSVLSSRSLTLQLGHPALYDLGFVAGAQWLAEDVGALFGL